MARARPGSATGWSPRPVGTSPGVDHPAVFPLALAEQLVKTFRVEGDLVLDPFCGSGQTLLAAKGCGRR